VSCWFFTAHNPTILFTVRPVLSYFHEDTKKHQEASIGSSMHSEILGEISDIEIIATGCGISVLVILRKRYGGRKWRELKGTAKLRLSDGTIRIKN
jgi:hypothetical protein